jgi:hypothetical protein
MADQPPYKKLDVVDYGGTAIATFTRTAREDQLITVEIRGGVAVRLEPETLATIATVLADDRLQLS